MGVYCAPKASIGKELFYGNSMGSGLMLEKHNGMLPNRQFRTKYTKGLNMTSPNCGWNEETVRHIVLACSELWIFPSDGAAYSLAMALGFCGRGEQPNWQAVETLTTSVAQLCYADAYSNHHTCRSAAVAVNLGFCQGNRPDPGPYRSTCCSPVTKGKALLSSSSSPSCLFCHSAVLFVRPP